MLDELASAGRENLDSEHVELYDRKEDADADTEVALCRSLGLTSGWEVVDPDVWNRGQRDRRHPPEDRGASSQPRLYPVRQSSSRHLHTVHRAADRVTNATAASDTSATSPASPFRRKHNVR